MSRFAAEKCGKIKRIKKKETWNRPVRSKYIHWLKYSIFLYSCAFPHFSAAKQTEKKESETEKGLTWLLGWNIVEANALSLSLSLCGQFHMQMSNVRISIYTGNLYFMFSLKKKKKTIGRRGRRIARPDILFNWGKKYHRVGIFFSPKNVSFLWYSFLGRK